MKTKQLSFLEASELLISVGYTLISKVNFSHAYYHENNPRQSIIVIPSNVDIFSKELSSKIYDAVNNYKCLNKQGE